MFFSRNIRGMAASYGCVQPAEPLPTPRRAWRSMAREIQFLRDTFSVPVYSLAQILFLQTRAPLTFSLSNTIRTGRPFGHIRREAQARTLPIKLLQIRQVIHIASEASQAVRSH